MLMSARKRAMLLTGLLLICAAFPLRIRHSIWIFHSVSILDLFLLLTPLWLLVVNWERPHQVALGARAIFTVLAMPLLLATASLAWSENPTQTIYYIIQTVLALSSYLLAVNLLQHMSQESIMRALALMILTAVATAAMALARVPGFAPDTTGMEIGSLEHLAFLASFYSRLSHPFWGLSNAFAGVLAFFVPVLIGWAIAARRPWYFATATLVFIAISLSLSRGVLLATLVGVLASLICWQRGRAAVVGSLATAIGFALMALWLLIIYNPVVGEYILDRLTSFTLEERLEKLNRAIAAIQDAPLLGYGAGVVPHGETLLTGGVHNSFVQAALEFGLPLGMLFTAFFLVLAVLLLGRRGPFAQTDPVMTVAVGGGLVAELVVFLTQASFEGAVLRILLYLGFGFGAALLRPRPEGLAE
jgi:O-antigen ligase